MSDFLPRDLLEQARRLVGGGKEQPPQADLRRAVSAAYYALFHLLSGEAAALVCPAGLEGLRPVLRRACDHGTMKRVCNRFLQARSRLPEPWNVPGEGGVPSDLRELAEIFVELQERRHAADYDLAQGFPRREVERLVERAQAAFACWERVAAEYPDLARLFLLALLFGERVRR